MTNLPDQRPDERSNERRDERSDDWAADERAHEWAADEDPGEHSDDWVADEDPGERVDEGQRPTEGQPPTDPQPPFGSTSPAGEVPTGEVPSAGVPPSGDVPPSGGVPSPGDVPPPAPTAPSPVPQAQWPQQQYGMSGSEQRNWAVGAHIGALAASFLGGLAILGPLLVYLIKKDQDAFVGEHAREALNFQLTWLIGGIVATIVGVIVTIVTVGLALIVLIPAGIGFFIAWLVFMVKASMAASRGEYYRYPMTIRLVS